MGCCSSTAASDGTYEPSPFTRMLAVKSKTDYTAASFDSVVAGNTPAATILVIATDDGRLTMANGKIFNTGNNPAEMLVPLLHFKAAGFAFEFATVSGGPVVLEMWGFPNKDEAVVALHKELKPLLEAPKKLKDLEAASLDGYAGIFIPGGHGAMVNLPESVELGKVLHAAHAKNLPTVALCHGPAALLAASKVAGAEFPYKGYTMVCFSDKSDKTSPKVGYMPGAMPWLVQEALRGQGVEVHNKSETGAIHVDRELITGDSPQASNKLGMIAAPILVAAWAKKSTSKT